MDAITVLAWGFSIGLGSVGVGIMAICLVVAFLIRTFTRAMAKIIEDEDKMKDWLKKE